MQRGIKQGCPISAVLFILVTEIMATKIRNDININGIKIKDSRNGIVYELKISQYADDTTLMLKDIKDVTRVIKLLKEFSLVSGLKINVDKTVGMGLGLLKNTNEKIEGVQFSNKPIKCLGIYVGDDQTESTKLNWEIKMEKVENVLKSWKSRDLTIFGKITIIKTLALSQLNYIAQNTCIPVDIINRLNKILFKFIWGKRDRVSRKLLYKQISEGGSNMVNVEIAFASLKVT